MPEYDISYEYDAAGNRTKMVDNLNNEVTTYVYDTANQLTLEQSVAGTTTYTYDADGNRTRKDGPVELTDYVWDAAGRMTQVKQVGGDTDFTYNADGQRVRKATPGGDVTRYIYDFERLLQETDDDDDPTREYTFTDSGYGDLVSEYKYGDGASSFPAYDAQWSAAALIDDAGSASDRYQYRAFGLQQHTTGTSDTKFTFVGKQGYYRDDLLDLYFLGMGNNRGGGRFYDPDQGRFLSKDRVEDDPVNPYRYVRNNPINVIDPSGEAPPANDPRIQVIEAYARRSQLATIDRIGSDGLNIDFDNVLQGGLPSRSDVLQGVGDLAGAASGALSLLPNFGNQGLSDAVTGTQQQISQFAALAKAIRRQCGMESDTTETICIPGVGWVPALGDNELNIPRFPSGRGRGDVKLPLEPDELAEMLNQLAGYGDAAQQLIARVQRAPRDVQIRMLNDAIEMVQQFGADRFRAAVLTAVRLPVEGRQLARAFQRIVRDIRGAKVDLSDPEYLRDLCDCADDVTDAVRIGYSIWNGNTRVLRALLDVQDFRAPTEPETLDNFIEFLENPCVRLQPQIRVFGDHFLPVLKYASPFVWFAWDLVHNQDKYITAIVESDRWQQGVENAEKACCRAIHDDCGRAIAWIIRANFRSRAVQHMLLERLDVHCGILSDAVVTMFRPMHNPLWWRDVVENAVWTVLAPWDRWDDWKSRYQAHVDTFWQKFESGDLSGAVDEMLSGATIVVDFLAAWAGFLSLAAVFFVSVVGGIGGGIAGVEGGPLGVFLGSVAGIATAVESVMPLIGLLGVSIAFLIIVTRVLTLAKAIWDIIILELYGGTAEEVFERYQQVIGSAMAIGLTIAFLIVGHLVGLLVRYALRKIAIAAHAQLARLRPQLAAPILPNAPRGLGTFRPFGGTGRTPLGGAGRQPFGSTPRQPFGFGQGENVVPWTSHPPRVPLAPADPAQVPTSPPTTVPTTIPGPATPSRPAPFPLGPRGPFPAGPRPGPGPFRPTAPPRLPIGTPQFRPLGTVPPWYVPASPPLLNAGAFSAPTNVTCPARTPTTQPATQPARPTRPSRPTQSTDRREDSHPCDAAVRGRVFPPPNVTRGGRSYSGIVDMIPGGERVSGPRVCRVWNIVGPIIAATSAGSEPARQAMRSLIFRQRRAGQTTQERTLSAIYDAGHLIADELGGPNLTYNLVPMLRSTNRAPGPWDDMEGWIKGCLRRPGITGGLMEVATIYNTAAPGVLKYIPNLITVTVLFATANPATSGLHVFPMWNVAGAIPFVPPSSCV